MAGGALLSGWTTTRGTGLVHEQKPTRPAQPNIYLALSYTVLQTVIVGSTLLHDQDSFK